MVAGEPLSYSIVVRNNGPDKINQVRLSDPLPGGTSLRVGIVVGRNVRCRGGLRARHPRCRRPPSRDDDRRDVGSAGTLTNTATISAPGITETDPSNDSQTVNTTVTRLLPQQNVVPDIEAPPDNTLILNFKAPKQVTVDQFMEGIVVSADCGGEPCLRRFREHAAINTGATHIAGFNLTVSRTSLGFSSTKKRVRLKPCLSGSSGGAHRRCVRNLRKAAEKAAPFRVKVVFSAIDKADNRVNKKAFVKVVP